MSRATYLHELHALNGINILVIEDLNLGGMSVTNDIENVVREIEQLEKINAEKYTIVYKDSDSIWDGWDARNERFVPCGQDTWYDAVLVMVSKKK